MTQDRPASRFPSGQGSQGAKLSPEDQGTGASQESVDPGLVDEDLSAITVIRTTASSAIAATEALSAVPGAPADGDDPALDAIRPGVTIASRYRLERVLGEGGMGRVFLATDLLYAGEFQDREDKVALKFLGARFAQHSESRLALQRETRKSQQLSHPNVVRVMHFDQHEGLPYMIMEYLEGKPLDEFLHDVRNTGCSFEKTLPMVEDMAAGLAYIHSQGLVHSDFKPGNVFVASDGRVKILDLGIARLHAEFRAGGQETVFDVATLGAMTPGYASAEMFEGLEPDPRDDVYALACVTYELLTGRHPFNGASAPKARAEGKKAERPDGLDRSRWNVLLQGLAFNRAQRTDSAEEFAEGLRGERTRRRWRMLALSALAAAGIITAAVLGVQILQPQDPAEVYRARLSALSENAGPLSDEDRRRIDNWLEQGSAYLDIARDVFVQGDLLSAHQILQTGADNAVAAFRSVLSLAPDPRAQQGMLDIVNLYEGWATRSLDDGNAFQALWMACHGLSLYAQSPDLLKVAEEARGTMSGSPNTDCNHMRAQMP